MKDMIWNLAKNGSRVERWLLVYLNNDTEVHVKKINNNTFINDNEEIKNNIDELGWWGGEEEDVQEQDLLKGGKNFFKNIVTGETSQVIVSID